ncbi:MAG: hypothetical protein ACLTEX_03200 [Eggerthella lenta]
MGNEVTVDNPSGRGCMGSFVNAWELAGHRGRFRRCAHGGRFDHREPGWPRWGFHRGEPEAIMALNPDFVIMTSGTGGRGGDSSQADLRDALAGAHSGGYLR